VDGTIDPRRDYVSELSASVRREWPAIVAAKQTAEEVRQRIAASLKTEMGRFSSDDIDVVVFGSLARGEWTSGSDVDWTLLIDGQVNPDHRTLARSIRDVLAATKFRDSPLRDPGAEGIFGNMAFSHEIIHNIGGQADTNRNTTQRLLLLLEAHPIRNAEKELGAYERVIRQILFRYLHDDTNFYATGGADSRIPRFMLNDIVRYWRTMCVDFAYKEWEQAGKKWALRNIKLRMSRKLLFASALCTVFSCASNASLRPPGKVRDDYLPPMRDHLLQFARATPANVVAWTLVTLGLKDYCAQLFDHYNVFLEKINDTGVRAHLDELSATDVYSDDVFLGLRSTSHEFQDVLKKIFFEAKTPLLDLIVQYGVF
jgi:predicted nucleotidyltransferase